MLKPDSLLALRFVRDAQLSPDGFRVACAVSSTTTDAEACAISLIDVATGATSAVTDGASFATSPRWSPDARALAFTSNGGLTVYDVARKNLRELLPAGFGVASPPSWSPDGASLVLGMLKVRHPGPVRHITRREFRMEGLGFIDDFEGAIVVVDLVSGAIRTLIKGGGAYQRPSFNPDGKRIMFLAAPTHMASLSPHIFVVPAEGGEPVCVAGEGWFIEGACWTPDGGKIVILGDYQSKITVPVGRLWAIGADGSSPELRTPALIGQVGLRAHHDMPIWGEGNAVAFAGDDALVGIQSRGRCTISRVALTGAPKVTPVVGGDRTCILTGCRNNRVLFIATDLMRPTELCVADLDGSHERRLTRLNDVVLADWPTLTTEHLDIVSPDGTAFEGWCVQRADAKGPQPTVLYIHGGPFLGQGHYFRFDTHLLASNGISVLFANFRGSAGYGEPFTEAILGDWGSRGFPDHMATVDAAIVRGLADPKALGVWGHSHGGFATSWIVGHTDRFAAAIAEASVTNYLTLYYLSDLPDGFVRDLGSGPVDIPDVYRSRSPMAYAHRCRTPTRIIHGERDLRCPLAEAEQFFRALQDVNCPSDLVILMNCDHLGDAMGPVGARVGQNQALLEWFERWLRPPPQ